MANTYAADATTVVLNGYAFGSFIAGDVLELAPINPLTSRVHGSNGSINVNKRTDSGAHTLTLRVERMSDDDIYLNSAVNQEVPTIFDGSMKTVMQRGTTDATESWTLENGTITTRPTEVINNQDGNFLMEYVIEFGNAQRTI